MKQSVMIFFALQALFNFAWGEPFYDVAAKSVIYLKVPKPLYEKVDGKWLELWHRDPQSGALALKMKTDTGTGFLVLHHGATYIVTAAHVVRDDAGRVLNLGEVWVNVRDTKATSLKVENMVKDGHNWFLHPSADIAVLPYYRPTILDVEAVDTPESWVQTNRPSLLSPVFAVGFPMGLGVGETLEPVAKRCQISAPSITLDANTNTPPYLLLDQALAQGYSGSPLYLDIPPMSMKHNFRLLGVMSAVRSDISGGKVSYVVPISALFDVFSSDAFRAYEKAKGLPRTPEKEETPAATTDGQAGRRD
jgi:S1-C subfamily serine protease